MNSTFQLFVHFKFYFFPNTAALAQYSQHLTNALVVAYLIPSLFLSREVS